MKIKHIALAVALAMGSGAVLADTSSAIRGKINTPEGTAAAGTKIIITHVPSGTTREVVTNESGSFIASGLRVGGPYTVVVDSDKYSDETLNNIFLQLGQNYQINETLKSESVERIAVTGSSILFNNGGSDSYFGADDIQNAPSFNRDLKDIIRNNPLAILSSKDGELSVAGTNPRFNSISVDGIAQNDDFGLNANGYPTTRSPISLDAIDQISINTSPFNAKASGFQGAQINAVTKSGTNDLSGSLFYETQNDSMAGTPKDNGSKVPLKFDETTYGGTLGGSIVEDKLFYFVSYEYYEAATPIEWGPNGGGAANQSLVSNADFLAVQRIAQQVYGVNAGDWNLSPVTDDEKLLMKLDWNINDQHRAAFTYQFTKGNRTSNLSDADTELRLSSHWYNRIEELNNYAFKLYSDWTPDFSTQFSATYMENPTTQASFGDFGDVTIQTASGRIALGSDFSRHSNELDKSTLILALDADYLYDDHSISFGYQYKSLDIFNLFLQNTKGSYSFDSLEDFEARQASRLIYQNSTSLNPALAAADFVRDEHAIYVHDEWAFNDEITFDMGVRYEMLASSDTPAANPNVFGRTGYNNTENLDGLGIVLPRLGFKWDATLDTTVRGGIGRFSGGQPTVWVSNAYSNTGVNIGFLDIETGDGGALEAALADISISDVPQVFKDTVASATAVSGTNFTDPNFKLPSDWRLQLAVDHSFEIPGFGEDYIWTTEYLYKRQQDTAFWVDASLTEGDKAGTTSDGGRLIYNDADGSTRDLMLTNADEDGRARVISTALSKAYDNGIRFTASYTNQDITDAHTSTSSTASSNYGLNTVINRNEALVGRSAFETEHRFVLNLGYETEIVPGYATNITLFFERRSGKPITYFLDGNDLDGRGPGRDPYGLLSPGTTNDAFLPYIPTVNDANVVFAPTVVNNVITRTAAENEAAFFNTINALGLDKYEGGYLPKGVSTTPWVNTLDLSIRQEVPGFLPEHKGTVYLTVDNLLNLIDSSQGKVYGSDFGNIELTDFTIDPVTKKYIYAAPTTNTSNYRTFYTQDSVWRLKVGVNYRF